MKNYMGNNILRLIFLPLYLFRYSYKFRLNDIIKNVHQESVFFKSVHKKELSMFIRRKHNDV